MRLFSIIALTLLLSIPTSFASAEKLIDKIIVFGDSFLANGFDYKITKPYATKIKNIPQLAKDFPTGIIPSANNKPYFSGRFSNGLVWVEYLNKMILNQLVAQDSSWQKNIWDYAAGGSGLDATKTFPPTLLQQVQLYHLQHGLKVVSGTVNTVTPHTLAIISLGYDYLLSGGKNIDALIAMQQQAIMLLQQNGVRYFLIMPLPDLSLTPLAVKKYKVDQLYNLTTEYNNKLLNMVNSLHDTNITVFDTNTLNYVFANLITNASKYKFVTVKPCYDINPNASLAANFISLDRNKAEQGIMLQMASVLARATKVNAKVYDAKECADGITNSNQHVYFDEVHPNSLVHCILSQFICSNLYHAGYVTLNSDLSNCDLATSGDPIVLAENHCLVK